jgi:hypothetical protein
LPSPRQILRLWLPSPKLGRGVGGEGKVDRLFKPDLFGVVLGIILTEPYFQ